MTPTVKKIKKNREKRTEALAHREAQSKHHAHTITFTHKQIRDMQCRADESSKSSKFVYHTQY